MIATCFCREKHWDCLAIHFFSWRLLRLPFLLNCLQKVQKVAIWEKKYFQKFVDINLYNLVWSIVKPELELKVFNLQSTYWFISSYREIPTNKTINLLKINMVALCLISNDMNNLGNEIFCCTNQLIVWKRGSNIYSTYKQIIKVSNFKKNLKARLEILPNEEIIKIKLLQIPLLIL